MKVNILVSQGQLYIYIYFCFEAPIFILLYVQRTLIDKPMVKNKSTNIVNIFFSILILIQL